MEPKVHYEPEGRRPRVFLSAEGQICQPSGHCGGRFVDTDLLQAIIDLWNSAPENAGNALGIARRQRDVLLEAITPLSQIAQSIKESKPLDKEPGAETRATGYWPLVGILGVGRAVGSEGALAGGLRTANAYPKREVERPSSANIASEAWQMQAKDLAIQLKAAIDDSDQADSWGRACAVELERVKAELAAVKAERPGRADIIGSIWREVSPGQLDSLIKGLREPDDEPCVEVRTVREWIDALPHSRDRAQLLENLLDYMLDVEPIGKLEASSAPDTTDNPF